MEKRNYAVSMETKQALAAALKQLMRQKSVEKITIQEITSLCGMKRQNFYYHFEDIYDLLRWMFQEEAVSLLKCQEGAQLWQEGMLRLFRYLQENREVCLCALRSLGHNHLRRFFEAEVYSLIHHTIETLTCELDGAEEQDRGYLDWMTHMYVLTLAGVLESWLLGKLDYTPEELVGYVNQTLQDQMRGATLRIKGQERSGGEGAEEKTQEKI